MRHRSLLPLVVVLVGVLIAPAVALAEDILPVSALIENPDAYDQTVVTIQGEIVGDFGRRGDIVWVQVNDDPYVDTPLVERAGPVGTNTGIAVRYPASMQGDWGPPGAYGIRGPIVEVTGVFRHLDPGTGGMTFVQAAKVTLIEPSRDVAIPGGSPLPVIIGGLLTVGGLVAMSRRRDMFPFVRL